MRKFPWFRLYANDLMNDRKFKRINKITGISIAEIRGVWLMILCLASESPERGRLLFDGGEPYDYDDLAEDSGADVMKFHTLFQHFTKRGMIAAEENIYYLPNWTKRQPNSDTTGAERVRKHRDNKKKTVTLPKRYSNGLDSDSDSELEEEAKKPAPANFPVETWAAPQVEKFIYDACGIMLNVTIERIGNTKRAIIEHGIDQTTAALSESFSGWCDTESENGKKYNPYNAGWIDWGLEYLMTGTKRWENGADSDGVSQTIKLLKAEGYEPIS